MSTEDLENAGIHVIGGNKMKFMVAWKIPPGCYKLAVERFLATGAPNPPGVATIGRWHAPGSTYGWHVVEHLGYEELAERYVKPTGRELASTPIERMVYAEKL